MKNVFLILVSALLFSACSKEVKELPQPSESGANKFGASVNGKLWVPQGFGVMPTAPILEARFGGNNSYIINARNFSASPTETEFEIYLKDVSGPGEYILNATTGFLPNASASYASYVERKGFPKSQWITTPEHTGKVIITKLDIPNKIIAGTFQFRGKDVYGDADPITVTDGRFDVQLQ